MRYQSTTIADIISLINKRLFIPSIQRPYVWEPEQIIRLFDSLMRDYPINSFLFWELQPENRGDWDIYNFVREFWQGEIHNKPANQPPEEPVTLVLDGQQRLTSLYIGLGGTYTIKKPYKKRSSIDAWDEKVLYLNLLKDPDAHEHDEIPDEIHYGFRFFSLDMPPKNSASAFWFKMGDILQIKNNEDLEQLCDAIGMAVLPHGKEKREAAIANLRRLYKTIWVDDSIAYYTEHSQSYDKVLEIFIRANDGGTKLSKSDLLMSMITLRWDQMNARDATENLLNKLKEISEPKKKLEREFLLRSSLFITDLDFNFKVKNFTSRNIAIIETRWQRIAKALLYTAEMFRDFGMYGTNLPGINPLMLIAYYVDRVNKQNDIESEQYSISCDDQEHIRRWIGTAFTQKILGLQTSATFSTYRKVIRETTRESSAFPAKTLCSVLTKRGRPMLYDDEQIESFCNIKAKDNYGFIALSLLYNQTYWRQGSYSRTNIFPPTVFREQSLNDSGYMESLFPTLQALSSTVLNHFLLTPTEAEEYLSMDFLTWINTRSIDFLERHHLPRQMDLYNQENLIGFFSERKRLITKHLRTLFDAHSGLHLVNEKQGMRSVM